MSKTPDPWAEIDPHLSITTAREDTEGAPAGAWADVDAALSRGTATEATEVAAPVEVGEADPWGEIDYALGLRDDPPPPPPDPDAQLRQHVVKMLGVSEAYAEDTLARFRAEAAREGLPHPNYVGRVYAHVSETAKATAERKHGRRMVRVIPDRRPQAQANAGRPVTIREDRR